jgi:hypothetical protein
MAIVSEQGNFMGTFDENTCLSVSTFLRIPPEARVCSNFSRTKKLRALLAWQKQRSHGASHRRSTPSSTHESLDCTSALAADMGIALALHPIRPQQHSYQRYAGDHVTSEKEDRPAKSSQRVFWFHLEL